MVSRENHPRIVGLSISLYFFHIQWDFLVCGRQPAAVLGRENGRGDEACLAQNGFLDRSMVKK
jgi:hypothetical protein